MKGKVKSETKIKWEKIKDKMDELVRTIDELNLERIKFHAQEIDRLCSKRSVDMLKSRKEKESKRKKNKRIKKY